MRVQVNTLELHLQFKKKVIGNGAVDEEILRFRMQNIEVASRTSEFPNVDLDGFECGS